MKSRESCLIDSFPRFNPNFVRQPLSKLTSVYRLSTWETKLRDLGLRKKLKRNDWPVIYQHMQMRKAIGKESDLFINGTKKERRSAWKEIRRTKATDLPATQGK